MAHIDWQLPRKQGLVVNIIFLSWVYNMTQGLVLHRVSCALALVTMH